LRPEFGNPNAVDLASRRHQLVGKVWKERCERGDDFAQDSQVGQLRVDAPDGHGAERSLLAGRTVSHAALSLAAARANTTSSSSKFFA
jgi:hypothetical protein